MVSFCFVGDSSFQAFGRECLFRGSLAENFVTYFLVVISLRLVGKHFLFRYFFEKNLFKICLDGNYSSEIFRAHFPAVNFW